MKCTKQTLCMQFTATYLKPQSEATVDIYLVFCLPWESLTKKEDKWHVEALWKLTGTCKGHSVHCCFWQKEKLFYPVMKDGRW